jgi:hypothetical protein
MGPEKGSQFWKLRSKHGREKIFSSPEILWESACEYFEWADSEPLKEERVFGTGLRMEVDKMRPFTIEGLCLYLGIGRTTFNDYRSGEQWREFHAVCEQIEQVIYTQQYSGAASGLLNGNIVSRALGLVDRQEQTIKADGLGKDVSKLSDEELKQYAALEQKLNSKELPEVMPVKTIEPDYQILSDGE